jgi:hypothetical protein
MVRRHAIDTILATVLRAYPKYNWHAPLSQDIPVRLPPDLRKGEP